VSSASAALGQRDLTQRDGVSRDVALVAGTVAERVTDSVLPHSSLLRCCTQRESRQV